MAIVEDLVRGVRTAKASEALALLARRFSPDRFFLVGRGTAVFCPPLSTILEVLPDAPLGASVVLLEGVEQASAVFESEDDPLTFQYDVRSGLLVQGGSAFTLVTREGECKGVVVRDEGLLRHLPVLLQRVTPAVR